MIGQHTPGSRGYHKDVLNAGPYEAGELRDLFVSLDKKELASSWVACVADSLMTFGVDLGNTTRALGVVSRRLHGVSVPCVVQGAVPMYENERAKKQMGEQGYAVFEGFLPPVVKGARHDPTTITIKALEPGQHVIFHLDKFKKHTIQPKLYRIRKETGWGDRLIGYQIEGNKFCVALLEDKAKENHP